MWKAYSSPGRQSWAIKNSQWKRNKTYIYVSLDSQGK
ncbi:hypothetical protein TNIN_165301, partial [Trichonephila inaurata madagascariensis]